MRPALVIGSGDDGTDLAVPTDSVDWQLGQRQDERTTFGRNGMTAPIEVEAFREFERVGWDDAAEAYADAATATTIQGADALLDAANVGAGCRALDVACGPGHVTAAAAERGAEVTGIDVAAGMVELARAMHPGLEFVVAAAEALPEADAAVDAVVSNFGLPHFADPSAVVVEFRRVTRPGGRVALSVWCPPDKVPFFGLVMSAVMAHGDMTAAAMPPGPDMFALSVPEAATSFLEGLDLDEVRTQEVPIVARAPATTNLVDFMRANTVRTRALLDAQAPGALAAIKEQVHEQQQRFVEGDELVMPMPSLVMSGTVR